MTGTETDTRSDIVIEDRWRGRLWTATPARVIVDEPGLVVYWCPAGTQRLCATNPDGQPREAPTRAERFAVRMTTMVWGLGLFPLPLSSLRVTRPDDGHSVWLGWDHDWSFVGWYVNVQRPLTRIPGGFQTMDLTLDAVIAPDLGWEWKDEDELATLVAAGVFTDEEAATFYLAGRAGVDQVLAGGDPWVHGGQDWRPDPSWAMPTLPTRRP